MKPGQKSCIPDDVRKEIAKMNLPNAGVVLENLPSQDLFANYDRYYSMYFNELYGLTNILYGFSTDIDFSVNVYETGTKKEIEQFELEHGGDLRVKTDQIPLGKWTMIGPWRQNKHDTKYRVTSKEGKSFDVNKVMGGIDYHKVRNEMVKNKTEKIKAKGKLTEEDKISIRKYGENMRMSDLIEEALECRNNEVPDDKLEYGVTIHDFKMKTTTQGKLHFENEI